MAEQIFHTVSLLEKRVIAKDILELRFTKPAGFTFLPGQFVQFKIADGAKFVLRSYSISSAPSEAFLEFCVKDLSAMGGKASAFFMKLAIGDRAELGAPKGRFVCAEVAAPIYFVATGTGLAPIKSILAHLTSALPSALTLTATQVSGSTSVMNKVETAVVPAPLHLLFGVRTEADIFWQTEIDTYRTSYPALRTVTTLTQPSDTWAGVRGRVTEQLQIDLTGHYYICGSVEMVKDVRAALTGQGIPLAQIHFEIF